MALKILAKHNLSTEILNIHHNISDWKYRIIQLLDTSFNQPHQPIVPTTNGPHIPKCAPQTTSTAHFIQALADLTDAIDNATRHSYPNEAKSKADEIRVFHIETIQHATWRIGNIFAHIISANRIEQMEHHHTMSQTTICELNCILQTIKRLQQNRHPWLTTTALKLPSLRKIENNFYAPTNLCEINATYWPTSIGWNDEKIPYYQFN